MLGSLTGGYNNKNWFLYLFVRSCSYHTWKVVGFIVSALSGSYVDGQNAILGIDIYRGY